MRYFAGQYFFRVNKANFAMAQAEALELEVQTLEDFKLYSLIALKSFLSVRQKSTVGSFDTLAAR